MIFINVLCTPFGHKESKDMSAKTSLICISTTQMQNRRSIEQSSFSFMSPFILSIPCSPSKFPADLSPPLTLTPINPLQSMSIGRYHHDVCGYPGTKWALRWRNNERNGVSNRRRLDCLLNRLLRRSSASLVFVRGIHRRPVNSTYKRPVTRKMFSFDDVIMARTSWHKKSW